MIDNNKLKQNAINSNKLPGELDPYMRTTSEQVLAITEFLQKMYAGVDTSTSPNIIKIDKNTKAKDVFNKLQEHGIYIFKIDYNGHKFDKPALFLVPESKGIKEVATFYDGEVNFQKVPNTDILFTTLPTKTISLNSLKGDVEKIKSALGNLGKIAKFKGTFSTESDRDNAIANPVDGDYVLIGSAKPYTEYIYDHGWKQAGQSNGVITGGATGSSRSSDVIFPVGSTWGDLRAQIKTENIGKNFIFTQQIPMGHGGTNIDVKVAFTLPTILPDGGSKHATLVSYGVGKEDTKGIDVGRISVTTPYDSLKGHEPDDSQPINLMQEMEQIGSDPETVVRIDHQSPIINGDLKQNKLYKYINDNFHQQGAKFIIHIKLDGAQNSTETLFTYTARIQGGYNLTATIYNTVYSLIVKDVDKPLTDGLKSFNIPSTKPIH